MITYLLKILINNKQITYSEDCIKLITESEVFINKGSFMPALHLYDVYYHRFKIQKEVTGQRKVYGYTFLLGNLKNCSETSEIKIISIVSQYLGFYIFIEKENNKVIGILKSLNINIEKKAKYIDNLQKIEPIVSIDTYIYNKGKFVKFIKNNRSQ